MTHVLEIAASGRKSESLTRQLSEDLIGALASRHAVFSQQRRDLADGVEIIDEDWINANFTPAEDRTPAQQQRLANSDDLVAELAAADIVVIGAPIYNFGVPAALKAWVDLIARARLTFRYTDTGPVGLLKNKKAYLVVASGGVEVDSPVDFATPYLRQALQFVGITDIEVISARQGGRPVEDVLDEARAAIAERIHTQSPVRAA